MNSLTGNLGATQLPPIGDSFMFFEKSGSNYNSAVVWVSSERTDFIQTSTVSFHYNRFSSSDFNLRSYGKV